MITAWYQIVSDQIEEKLSHYVTLAMIGDMNRERDNIQTLSEFNVELILFNQNIQLQICK